LHGRPDTHDAYLLPAFTYQADFRYVNLFVNAVRFLQCYGRCSEIVYSSKIRQKLSRATPRCDFSQKSLDQGLKGHLPEILTTACAHGHQSGFLFLIAYNDLIGQPVQAMFAYFIGYFLVAQI
jgi:hypothetical protein